MASGALFLGTAIFLCAAQSGPSGDIEQKVERALLGAVFAPLPLVVLLWRFWHRGQARSLEGAMQTIAAGVLGVPTVAGAAMLVALVLDLSGTASW